MKKTLSPLQVLDQLREQRASYTIDKLWIVKSLTSIEGCIGTGKSTFLGHMRQWARDLGRDVQSITQDSPDGDYYMFVEEPVGPWVEKIYHSGRYGDPPVPPDECNPMLDMYYTDPPEMAFAFQIFAFTTRICAMRDGLSGVELIARILSGQIRIHIVCERSLRTDALFMFCQYLLRNATQLEWDVYRMLHGTVCDALLKAHNGMVYVQTPLDVCAVRIKERNRGGEERVTISYQQTLKEQHDVMVDRFEHESAQNRVYRIDASKQMNSEELTVVAHALMERIDADVSRL